MSKTYLDFIENETLKDYYTQINYKPNKLQELILMIENARVNGVDNINSFRYYLKNNFNDCDEEIKFASFIFRKSLNKKSCYPPSGGFKNYIDCNSLNNLDITGIPYPYKYGDIVTCSKYSMIPCLIINDPAVKIEDNYEIETCTVFPDGSLVILPIDLFECNFYDAKIGRNSYIDSLRKEALNSSPKRILEIIGNHGFNQNPMNFNHPVIFN